MADWHPDAELQGVATRWVDDEPQPGLVEVQMKDAFGRTWVFIDKEAMFGGSELGRRSDYPAVVTIPVRIVSNDADRMTVESGWVESTDGVATFIVPTGSVTQLHA